MNKVRFFARIRRAEMECPRCTRMLIFGSGNSKHAQTSARWDSALQRVKCPPCGLTLSLGIVARRVPDGVNRKYVKPPVDVKPTIEQALQLRQEMTGGEWREGVRKGGEAVNEYED